MTTRLLRGFVLTMSAAMLITLFVPSPADASSNPPYHSTPCPSYSIQNVHNDPNTDWDHDRVSNVVELYNGLNPCINDTGVYCATHAYHCKTVTHYDCSSSYYYGVPISDHPHADWDYDGVSNSVELSYGANPCKHPCPHPRQIDVRLNPYGAWDGDGVSNSVEVGQGTDPCNRYSYNPCPNWKQYQLDFMPHSDWDHDGITNVNDVRLGYSPCSANTVLRLPHVQTAPKLLPHVYTPAPAPPPAPAPAPGYKCPAGYPHYHPGNGLCYANPIPVYNGF